MAKAKAKTAPPLKSARSIEQELELPGHNVQAEAIPDFDVVLASKEEEKALDLKKEEGVRKLKINNDLLQAQVDKLNNDNEARKPYYRQLLLTLLGFW